MTTQDKIKVIIERAMKGGWDIDSYFGVELSHKMGDMPEGDLEAKIWLLQGKDCIFLDPDFYRALGKSCNWSELEETYGLPKRKWNWKTQALRFHEINLTQSFEAGIDYLYNLVEKK